MPDFRHLLACVDLASDETALVARAAEQATRHGVGLTLLHVIDERPLRAYDALSPEEVGAAYRALEAYDVGRLETLAAEHPAVEIVTVVRRGDPLTEIVAQIGEGGHDVVLCGADHGRRLGERLFGGTTTRLLRTCPVPVWVVNSDQTGPYRAVLAAVDLAPVDGSTSALDARIVGLAGAVADVESAALHVIHVCSSWAPFSGIDEELHEYREQLILASKRQLDRLMTLAGRPDAILHRPEGDPGRSIRECVDEHAIDLVVMGTVARQGLRGLLFGNTAERVLARIPCSLIAVKPDGFVCPLPDSTPR